MSKPGDIYEVAIWADGTEDPALLDRFKADARKAFGRRAKREGVAFGKLRLTEKQPNEDRVPPVPDHIQGPNVRLVVVEATVVAYKTNSTAAVY